MTVADIGAGEGYYTVRLSPMVGPQGPRAGGGHRARDDPTRSAQRVKRERLDNVAIRLGQPNDPQLPAGSFDRVFMIHMYHEIDAPSEFLWNLRAGAEERRPGHRRRRRPADRPATARRSACCVCEFNAVGYG